MNRCEICQRRTRSALMVERTVSCQVCFERLVRGEKVPIRGPGFEGRVAMFDEDRNLVFKDDRKELPPIPVMGASDNDRRAGRLKQPKPAAKAAGGA